MWLQNFFVSESGVTRLSAYSIVHLFLPKSSMVKPKDHKPDIYDSNYVHAFFFFKHFFLLGHSSSLSIITTSVTE